MKNLSGFAYLLVIDQFVNMVFGQVTQIPRTYPIFKREVSNNMYGATSYYLARTLISIMTFFFYPFLLTLCMIWFLALPVLNFTVFVGWVLDLLLICLVASSIGMTIGCIVPESSQAILVANLVVTMMNLGAGLLANTNTGYLVRFLGWVSPQHYGMELIMRRLLDGKNEKISNDVLSFLGYDYGTDVCYYVLLSMLVFYILIGWIAISFRATV